MSLSDRFKSIKKSLSSNKDKDSIPSAPEPAEPPKPSHTTDELGRMIQEERSEGEAKQKAIEKELQDIRSALEKIEVTSKSARETQNQTLQFLQQDAERDIKFFERKLREDMAQWDKQLKDREKAVEKVSQQTQAGQLEKKALLEGEETAGREAADRAEALVKEQEAKLIEERRKWRELLQAKEAELLAVKKELAEREAAIESEFKQQEIQRQASQELWQSRLKDLERQWADRRKSWEEAMKAKEEERLRLHSTFQEKQASWQLEQERRIHEATRRQERAQEKLSALKVHLIKETQNWRELAKGRDDQVQQLKVKLLLSESESKGQLDQAQKAYQESLSHVTAQIQTLQRQLQQEQELWQKKTEEKDLSIKTLKDDMQAKLKHLETDFTQRMTVLQSEKETLNAELLNLQTQYRDAQEHYAAQTQKLKEEQAALEISHQTRLSDHQKQAEREAASLHEQVISLEKQKAETEKDLEAHRQKWQVELSAKDQALKELHTAVDPQVEELRKRYAADEETARRHIDGVKIRLRALERDLARVRESLEKSEKDQTAMKQALQAEHEASLEAQKARSSELATKLSKRLEERRLALQAFLVMKKSEETRVQTTLKEKEKERAQLAQQVKTLPEELAKSLEAKKKSVEKESADINLRIAELEKELAKARETSKSTAAARATQVSALRQELEQKQKEMTADIKSQEQMLESERAQIEKQMTTGQAEIDRVRTHWEMEIAKKEKEIQSLQEELRKQETLHRDTFAIEQKKLDDQIKPLEQEHQALTQTLQQRRAEHDEAMRLLDLRKKECQDQIRTLGEQERANRSSFDVRLRDDRAQWKARLAALVSEREGVLTAGRDGFEEKSRTIEQLEEQLRARTVAHETRKRELIHQATQKTRTLQDIIRQIEDELKSNETLLPQQLEERQAIMTRLTEDLSVAQKKHERHVARYERAMATLARRGHEKEETLKNALRAAQEEFAKKLADKDAQLAALQSDLLAKDTERQGELDRLAKQFAEERFQLEKSKEELDWKLKDRKEVSERQLSTRQKEIHAIETEVHRAKESRDKDMAARAAAFDSEKKKLQVGLASLQKQTEETRGSQESALSAKEQELQALLLRSQEHLKVLGDEFNQKVNSWRGTNDTLRGHIEQLKLQSAQAKDHWDALRKEKDQEIGALRQDLAQWEARIKTDADEFERTFNQERQMLVGQIRHSEKTLQDMVADYEKRTIAQDDAMARGTDEVRNLEQNSEAQWHAALEQWQMDKQALQQQKITLEHDLVSLQNRYNTDIRHTDEAMAKLKMEIAFKETHAASQKDKLAAQLQRDLDPLRDRLSRLSSDEEKERTAWEIRLKGKDDEIKMLKARLALREKRIQDENRRRSQELEKLRQQVSQETENARARLHAEQGPLEKLLLERREALAYLQSQESAYRKTGVEDSAEVMQRIAHEREQLEESIRQTLRDRDCLRAHYERLLQERDHDAESLARTLDAKEEELEALRRHAKEQAEVLRRKMESLRHAEHASGSKHGPTSAAAWNSFEAGVISYQAQQWEPAVHAFEECLKKDPRWGAAYQYLALAYHAQGDIARAALVAARAKEFDPTNTQLATWVDRLQHETEQRKAS